MQYKMILSDIDGTIINSKHQITKNTKDYLQSLDIPVVLVSARSPAGIQTVKQQFDNVDPMICFSGALIIDKDNIIYDTGIDIELAKKVYQELSQITDLSVSTYCYENWYVSKKDHWIEEEENITGLKSICEEFFHEKKVHKFLCIANPKLINEVEECLKEKFPELAIYKSKPTYLEIMSGDTNKAKAIEYLLKINQLNKEDVISFGDNYNDVEMLEMTGMSFVMANAPEPIKERIQRITKSNDEDGVIYALKHLI